MADDGGLHRRRRLDRGGHADRAARAHRPADARARRLRRAGHGHGERRGLPRAAARRAPRRVPARAHPRAARRAGARRRSARLHALVVHGKLRVEARECAALRPRARRLRDAGAHGQGQRPRVQGADVLNVLVVMADQLVPFLTGPYGDPVAQTPNMDAVARDGFRYDAAYTPYPLCAPARAAFMCGQYASRHGCYDNAAILPADVPTLAHSLTLAGYDTVLSGKMHFVGPDQLHGFARRLTTDVFPAAMDWVPTQDPEGRFLRGGHARSYVPPRVGVVEWTKFLAYDEETHFRALEYLRNGRADPFFLVVSYHHPHDPFQVTQELWDLYD